MHFLVKHCFLPFIKDPLMNGLWLRRFYLIKNKTNRVFKLIFFIKQIDFFIKDFKSLNEIPLHHIFWLRRFGSAQARGSQLLVGCCRISGTKITLRSIFFIKEEFIKKIFCLMEKIYPLMEKRHLFLVEDKFLNANCLMKNYH